MNENLQVSLLNYKQVAQELGVSVKTVRKYVSTARPRHVRLQVVRLGHRTARVRIQDLEKFKESCLGINPRTFRGGAFRRWA